MKRVIVALILMSMMACNVAFAQKKGKPIKLKNENDSISYIMGRLVGEVFEDQALAPIKKEINHKIFHEAIQSTMKGEEMTMDYSTAVEFMTEYINYFENKENTNRRERGRKFLADNAKGKGVQVTSSGLQYKIEQEGDGEEYPGENSYVTANIKGVTFEGYVFREVDENEYFTSYMDDILAGCVEGMMMMSRGAKYTLYLPYELGHGEEGAHWKGVKPYDVLIYEIELVDFSDTSDYARESDCDCEDCEVRFEAPREAGDYWQTRAAEAREVSDSEDMRAYHDDMRTILSIGDYYYIHMDGGYSDDESIVVVDKSGKQIQSLNLENMYWRDALVGVYTPLDENSKDKTIVMICNIYDYRTSTTSSDIYSQNSDGTLERIGTVPMEIVGSDYYSDYKNIIDVMSIHSVKGGLRFEFDQKLMKYSTEDDYTYIPGEDIHYDYKYADGSFMYGGVATNLTFFKRQSLKRIVRGVNPEQIDILTMGDLNGDGDIDVLYTRNDDSKIYINLCKDYKIVKKLVVTIDTGFTFDRNEESKIISSKGEISLYRYENNEYKERTYILKDDKLVETQKSKESQFMPSTITSNDSMQITISEVKPDYR